MQRLFGRQPTAGRSLVAEHLGATGELVVVILVNLAVGFLLAAAFQLLARKIGG